MKKLFLIFATIVLNSCSNSENKDWTVKTPKFEDFKTTSFCKLTAVESRPNLLNTQFSIEEKNKIKERYLNKESFFNCEYSISSFKNEKNDWVHVIVHAPSGNLIGSLTSNNGILYSKASSLIIKNPIDKKGNTDENSEFWVVEENELKKIK